MNWLKKNCWGYSITEILIVTLLFSVTAAFALPLYNKSIRKSRERRASLVLASMHSAALTYRTINGTFWNNGGGFTSNLGDINSNLNTNILADSIITYSYNYDNSGPTAFTVRASWVEDGVTSILNITENANRVRTGPCCSGAPGVCLVFPDC